MSELVSKTLGINCSITMKFGATIIDTNPYSGYDSTEMETKRNEYNRDIRSSLMFYPEAVDTENESLKNSINDEKESIALAACWINGFVPYGRGMPDAEDMTRNCETYLKTQNIITTDQIFTARPEGHLEALLWHFKWYGGDEKIIDDEFVEEKNISKVVQKGLVSRNWGFNPTSIRYMVREKASSDEVPDYLYFIGGSDEMLDDDMSNTIKLLQSLIKTYEMNKNNINIINNVWCVKTSDSTVDDLKIDEAENAMIRIRRIVQGIFFIRNYLIYAKNVLSIEKLVEVDFRKKKRFNKVSIDKIIDKYEGIYQYCKNCFEFGVFEEMEF